MNREWFVVYVAVILVILGVAVWNILIIQENKDLPPKTLNAVLTREHAHELDRLEAILNAKDCVDDAYREDVTVSVQEKSGHPRPDSTQVAVRIHGATVEDTGILRLEDPGDGPWHVYSQRNLPSLCPSDPDLKVTREDVRRRGEGGEGRS